METASYYLGESKYTLTIVKFVLPFIALEISSDTEGTKIVRGEIVDHVINNQQVTIALLVQGRTCLLAVKEDGYGALVQCGVTKKTVRVASKDKKIIPALLLSKFEPNDISEKRVAEAAVLVSPLTGKVARVLVCEGEYVSKGQPLAVIESMKMENELCAPYDAIIKNLFIHKGDVVKTKQELMRFRQKKGDGNAAPKEWYGEAKV